MINKGKAVLIIVISIMVLIFVIAFVAIDKLNYKPLNDFISNPDRGTTTTTTVNEENKGNTLTYKEVASREFEVDINGKTKVVEFIYNVTDGSLYNGPEDVMIYGETHLVINIDGIKVHEDYLIDYNFKENVYEYEELTNDNINVIKGNDQEYLVFEIYKGLPFTNGVTNLYIYNDVAQLVDKVEFEESQTISFRNHTRRYKYSKNDYRYVIDKDKIYYMDTKLDGEENKSELVCQYAREYELTIKDGKVNRKALDLVKVDIAGGC